jgi:hypothetical protein
MNVDRNKYLVLYRRNGKERKGDTQVFVVHERRIKNKKPQCCLLVTVVGSLVLCIATKTCPFMII